MATSEKSRPAAASELIATAVANLMEATTTAVAEGADPPTHDTAQRAVAFLQELCTRWPGAVVDGQMALAVQRDGAIEFGWSFPRAFVGATLEQDGSWEVAVQPRESGRIDHRRTNSAGVLRRVAVAAA